MTEAILSVVLFLALASIIRLPWVGVPLLVLSVATWTARHV